MNIRRVVVHGVNGIQGGAIARQLVEEGFEVRGTVRNPAKSASPPPAEVEIAVADLESASALRSASADMDAVVLTLPMTWERETALRWAQNAALAARDSGARMMIVNSSTRIPDVRTDVPAFELRRAVETVVREFGPPSIILRHRSTWITWLGRGSRPASRAIARFHTQCPRGCAPHGWRPPIWGPTWARRCGAPT